VAKINAKSTQLREAKGTDVDQATVVGWLSELLLLKHEVRPHRARVRPRAPRPWSRLSPLSLLIARVAPRPSSVFPPLNCVVYHSTSNSRGNTL
jgi:hypothetical protein